jgi:hypothetical protein
MSKPFLIFIVLLITSCKTEIKPIQIEWTVQKTTANCIFPNEGCNVVFKTDKLVFRCAGKTVEKEALITSTHIITSLYANKQIFEITFSGDSIMKLSEKYSQTPIKIILQKKIPTSNL